MRKIFTLLLVFLAVTAACAVPADSIIVSIVNFYPGADIYELEGHTALRVRWSHADPGVGISYGTFDFEQPNFVYRFVKGETDYWVTQVPWEPFEDLYRSQGRRIVEHTVDMDSAQKVRLMTLLSDNLRPENRTYRYNYVKDNCATRPLRMVELALGDSIILAEPDTLAGETTFRKVMEHYHKNYPWYQFGIDLALGSGIDYPISTREKSFAPALLDRQLGGATVAGRKLTNSEHVLYEGADATLGPTPWYLTPLFVCWLFFAIVVFVTWRDMRRHAYSRWLDTVMYTVYGVCGLVICFLVFISTHEATSPNWLFLWLNPLCLLVPALIWLKKCKNVVFSYQIINFALVLLMSVTWPLHSQHLNAAFVPLIAADLLRSGYCIYHGAKQKKLKTEN